MAKLANVPRMLRVRVDAKGRITVPKVLCLQLGLTASSQVLLRVAGEELHGIAAPAAGSAAGTAAAPDRNRFEAGWLIGEATITSPVCHSFTHFH
jgi:bifunctional DNA-binding transcriptional regulator/antitoxin component of YhaV-PrlF toxin-antitoxin module